MTIRIPLEGTFNTRDLGGYPTSYGVSTVWRRFFRSDDVVFVTEADIQLLQDIGVHKVIDLRASDELKERPNPLSEINSFEYTNISLVENLSEYRGTPIEQVTAEYLPLLYRMILEKEQDALADALRAAIPETDKAVLFHCTAGKDRTGLMAMLLLGNAGVDDADIIANYEVTYTYISNNPYLKKYSHKIPVHLVQSARETMVDTIAFIKEQYSSYSSYLRHIGLSAEETQTLREALLVQRL